ncbi:MAG: restriction endonuclease, partial [Clostridia bacterium]|nr:restriction endonuclease [Clostridia bacterium]
IQDIPRELQEVVYTSIDLTPFKVELRSKWVIAHLQKSGLTADEEVLNQLSELPISYDDLLSHIFEIRNLAYAKGVSHVTADLLVGDKTSLPEIEEVDRMDGRIFELFTGALFRELGYYDIAVTPSSGDFGADVIAAKDDVRFAIQCKRYEGPVGVSAVQEVMASRSLHDCHVACVLTNSSFTPAAIELARKNLVILWDRTKLCAFIEKTKTMQKNK